MRSIQSTHRATMRADRYPRAMLAPSATELEIRAACQRARDARAAAARRRNAESRRVLLRLWVPAWVVAALVTGCAVVGGM